LYRRLGDPEGRFGREEKISTPTPKRFVPQTVQLVASHCTN
jgi:hypothetical protein